MSYYTRHHSGAQHVWPKNNRIGEWRGGAVVKEARLAWDSSNDFYKKWRRTAVSQTSSVRQTGAGSTQASLFDYGWTVADYGGGLEDSGSRGGQSANWATHNDGELIVDRGRFSVGGGDITINNLNRTKTYTIEMVGSDNDTGIAQLNVVVNDRADRINKTYPVLNGNNDTVLHTGIVPKLDGTIKLTISTALTYVIMNALRIIEEPDVQTQANYLVGIGAFQDIAAAAGGIMNQMQKGNLGADLYDGTLQ